MESHRDYRNSTKRNRSDDLGMSGYERATSQRKMNEAVALADLALRISSRIRAALGNAARVLRGTLTQKRDYVKDGVVHFD